MANMETLKQFKYIFNKSKAYFSETHQSFIIPRTYKKYLRTDIKTIFELDTIKSLFTFTKLLKESTMQGILSLSNLAFKFKDSFLGRVIKII